MRILCFLGYIWGYMGIYDHSISAIYIYIQNIFKHNISNQYIFQKKKFFYSASLHKKILRPCLRQVLSRWTMRLRRSLRLGLSTWPSA